MIKVEYQKGPFEEFKKSLNRLEKEHRKQIAGVFRKHLRDAAAFGRSRISGLFGGRGKRLQKAFGYGVRIAADDVVGRVGYIRRGKGSAAFLGRFYETGVTIRNRTKLGRYFEGGQRVSGRTRYGRALIRAGVSGSKKLWIPIGANRDAGGAAIVTARQFFSQYQGRSMVRPSKAGNLIAFANESGSIRPMFVLKDQVRIPARPVLPSVREKFLSILTNELGQQVFSFFKGLKR